MRKTAATVAPVRPQDADVPKEALELVPRETAVRYAICPLGFVQLPSGAMALQVAAPDPDDLLLSDYLQRLLDMRIQLTPATPQDITRGIEMHYALAPQNPEALLAQPEVPATELAVAPGNDSAEFTGARMTVEDIFQRAITERATDIHLQPEATTVTVRFRIDGVMADMLTYDLPNHPSVISRIKILANLDIAQTRLPQDGRFEVSLGKWVYDVRVSIVPITFGEKAVLRMLPKGQLALDLDRMGFSDLQQQVLDEQIIKPFGMLLATGPTGSGKTTTLYALLSRLDCVEKNVITVEDPIEYQLPRVAQIQVHPKIGLTFAAGLRAILRQDPDIIMVGEIRDPDTLEMGIQSALTGHLVFSTLHCNDAAAAAARMIDMGEEPFLIASSINAITSQRLVRKICLKCKAEVAVSRQARAKLGLPDDAPIYAGTGCDNCRGTGYLGRIGLFEVVPMIEPVQEAIIRKASATEIRNIIRAAGIPTLREDGLLKVQAGVTTLEEYIRAVYEH